MNMKKIVMIISALLINSVITNAQLKSYVVFGSSHGIELKHRSMPGYHFGAMIEMPAFLSLNFQTGLEINQVKMDKDEFNVHYSDNQMYIFNDGSVSEYNYIEVPLILTKNFFKGDTGFFMSLGGYASLFSGGQTLLRTDTNYADYISLPSRTNLLGCGLSVSSGIRVNKILLGIEGNLNLPDGRKSTVVLKTKFAVYL
jgi:hypothetical protein